MPEAATKAGHAHTQRGAAHCLSLHIANTPDKTCHQAELTCFTKWAKSSGVMSLPDDASFSFLTSASVSMANCGGPTVGRGQKHTCEGSEE